MSDVGDRDAAEEADGPDGPERPEGPSMVGSGGDDISAGIIVSGTGGRRLDDDREPGHSDLDDIIERSRSQPPHRPETG